MISTAKRVFFAAIAALSIALPTAVAAQSAYTSGTAASRERAGYPSPYGGGFYAYAPSYSYGRTITHRFRRNHAAH